MPVDLRTIALAKGDTAPHSMSEMYNVRFTDRTKSPASGAISLNDFNGKTIGIGALDTLSTTVYNKITGAYALCRLFLSYSGPQIRVRRSSDNAVLDVYFDADGYVSGTSLDSWLGANTGYIVTWYDQGPSGKHMYGYGSPLPSIYKIYNYRYVIYFNGTSSVNGGYFDAGSFTQNVATNGGFSSFSCVNFLSPDNWERVYDFGNTNNDYNTLFARAETSLTSRFEMYQGSGFANLDTGNAVSDNSWKKYSNRIQGSGSTWTFSTRIDSANISSGSRSISYTNRTVSRSWIGRSNWGGDSYSNMYLACQVFLDTGAITDNDFLIMEQNIFLPAVAIAGTAYTYTNLSNIPGSSFVSGTWRDYIYETLVLPAGFSTSSSAFKLTVTMSGTMQYGPEQYIWCGMVKSDNSASCTVDLSAGWSGNQPSWWSYNGNTIYTNATMSRTTLNNGTFAPGDTVKLMFALYNSYWLNHSCTIKIEW